MKHNSFHLLREHVRGSLLWLRQLLIDTDSYSNDWPPPFNIKPGRHFALRGDNDEEVIEKLKKQQAKYWVFKFVDLVFVALLSKLSKVLENCALSFHSFLFVTSLFCLLFVTRMMADEYGVQFIAHDSFHIVCYYVYFMSNFIMVLNINVVENHEHLDSVCSADFVSFGFFVGFVCSRVVILILFSRVVVEDELWKESSQKTLGHELHDTVLANCQHQAQWTEVDGEGRYVPCAQCAAHEFANCDADDGCARCARHEECFWACKDSCNAILAQYPNQRFTPEDIAFSVGMLRTLKDAIISRRLYLAGFGASLQYPPLFPLNQQERSNVEGQKYFDFDADGVTRCSKVDGNNQFDISRDEDVDNFASHFQDVFGENGEAVISLADEGWGPWFKDMEEKEARGSSIGGGESALGGSFLLELKEEMQAKAKDVEVVHGFVKAFLASREADDEGWFVKKQDFDAVTERLKHAVDARHRRVKLDDGARAEFARLKENLITTIDERYTEIASSRGGSGSGTAAGDEGLRAEIRKFLLDDREKFLRLARLHCLALLEPPVGMERVEDLRRRTFAKALYCSFYTLLDSFQASKMREDAKRNHGKHLKLRHAEDDGSRHSKDQLDGRSNKELNATNFRNMVYLLSDEEILAKVSAQSLNNRGWEQFGGTMIAISVSLAIVSINMLAEYIIMGRKGKGGKYPEEYKVYAYVLALLVEIGNNVSRTLQGKHNFYNIGNDFFAERLHDFLLITLGEAVILLLAPYYRPKDTEDGVLNKEALTVYLTAFSSCCLIFLFAYQFFEKFAIKDEDDEENEEPSDPDDKHYVINLMPFLFKWLHLGLAICVFFASAALGILFTKINLSKTHGPSAAHSAHSAPSPDHAQFVDAHTMLATSVAFFVIFMTLLRSLKGRGEWSLQHKDRSRLLAKASKLLFAVLHFCLAARSLKKAKAYAVIAGHCALLALNTLSDGQTKGFFSKHLRARFTWLFSPQSSSGHDDAEEQRQTKARLHKKKKSCATCGRSLIPGTCTECCSVQSRGFKRGKAVDRDTVRLTKATGPRPTALPSLGSVYNSANVAFTSNPLTKFNPTPSDSNVSPSPGVSSAHDHKSVSRTIGRILVASDDPLGKSTAHRLSINAARRNSASASAAPSPPSDRQDLV